MTRRSTRLKSKSDSNKRSPHTENTTSLDGDRDSNVKDKTRSTSSGRTTKHRRTSHHSSTDDSDKEKKRSNRRRRGLLKDLVEAPIDVIIEIFSHLQLPDILALSRTTKALRSILLDKNYPGTLSIWKTARSNDPRLPRFPDDLEMSEPHYASLLFDTFCKKCSAQNTQSVAWIAQKRLCGKCLEADYLEEDALKSKIRLTSSAQPVAPILHVIPTYRYILNGRVREVEVITYSYSACRQMLKAYGSIEDAESKQSWLKDKEKDLAMRKKFAKDCANWSQKRSRNRSMEIRDQKQERKAAIYAKLYELGWKEELDKMKNYSRYNFDHHKYVLQAKPLTDRIWANIKPTLVEMLTDIKNERLALERRNALYKRHRLLVNSMQEYRLSQPVNAIIPDVGDISRMEPFRRIIHDTAVDVAIQPESFKECWDLLPSLTEQWRKDAVKKLLKLAPSLKNESDLFLATTTFTCDNCGESPITFPRILVHRCCTRMRPNDAEEHEDFTDLGKTPWSVDKFIVWDSALSNLVKHLLRLAELDADTTWEEFLACEESVECSDCPSDCHSHVMRVAYALDHFRKSWKEGHKKKTNLRRVTDVEKPRVPTKHRTPPEHLLPAYGGQYEWHCSHCRAVLLSYELNSHMRIKHRILNHPDNDIRKEFVPDLDATKLIPEPEAFLPVPRLEKDSGTSGV